MTDLVELVNEYDYSEEDLLKTENPIRLFGIRLRKGMRHSKCCLQPQFRGCSTLQPSVDMTECLLME